MKIKRILAYLLDILLVSFISSLIFSVFCRNQAEEFNKTYQESAEFILKAGSGEVNEDELIDLTYRMQYVTKTSSIINVGLLIIYFGVGAYLMKGQTLGKKLLNIKVAPINDKELNPGLFMLRAVLVTNFIPKLINLVALLLCNKNLWYEINVMTSNASTIIIFILIGFMIFRDDERGLHDLICQTKVISTKEEK